MPGASELRVTSRSSTEGYGNDAARVEFRIRGANNNRLDLKCGRTSVPGTWLSVSHTGPALISTIQAFRQQRARVEGPDHVQQLVQRISTCELDLSQLHVNTLRSHDEGQAVADGRRSWKRRLGMPLVSLGRQPARQSPLSRHLLNSFMISGCRSRRSR